MRLLGAARREQFSMENYINGKRNLLLRLVYAPYVRRAFINKLTLLSNFMRDLCKPRAA